MFSLILGLLLFITLHLSRELGLRPVFIHRLSSEKNYKSAYSLLALLGLGLIIWGRATAPFIMLWQPRFELRYISHMLMIPAVIFVIAGNTPLSYIRQQFRHPMLVGVALWGIAHLWSNGDLASILLFGTFSIWASFKFFSLSAIVSSSQANKKPYVFWDIIAVVVGATLYILIGRYHGQLFGIGLEYY